MNTGNFNQNVDRMRRDAPEIHIDERKTVHDSMNRHNGVSTYVTQGMVKALGQIENAKRTYYEKQNFVSGFGNSREMTKGEAMRIKNFTTPATTNQKVEEKKTRHDLARDSWDDY